MNNKPHQRLLDGMPPHIAEKVDKMIGNMKEIYDLAMESWEGCDGCDENDKNFFINGFRVGYNIATPDKISDEESLRLAKEMNKQPMTFVPSEISEKYQQYRDWLNEIPEISDEEIEKASQKTYPVKEGGPMSMPTRFDLDQYNRQIGFVAGIMWYKEQLKQRQ